MTLCKIYLCSLFLVVFPEPLRSCENLQTLNLAGNVISRYVTNLHANSIVKQYFNIL